MFSMSKKELEVKILKHLHKANRGKTTRNKLEKLDEAFDILQALSASLRSEQQPSGSQEITQGLLDQYRELGCLYKLKFQMDALLSDVKHELSTIEKSVESFSQEQFDALLQRLHVILDIDAGHPEAPVLLDALTRGFPQYAEQSFLMKTYIDLAPYQASALSIEVECPLNEVQKSSTLEAISATNRIGPCPEQQNDADAICRFRFSQEQLKAFEPFHQELHTKSTYRIFVNTRPIEEKAFTLWFNCYKRSLSVKTPQYCYGASPLTFNFFGCHKLYMPDIAKHTGLCWFQFGILDQKSGIFLVDRHRIVEQIRQSLENCGFCPVLTQDKLNIGVGLLPQYINPECDRRWKYLYHHEERVGVIPAGDEIATSLQPQEAEKVDLASVIEIGHTPSIDLMLRYLVSSDTAELRVRKYQGFSRCLNCGSTYKPHTMICPKCKIDFGKYAVRNPETVLHELTYTSLLELPIAAGQRAGTESSQPDEGKSSVSFEQLWNDPKVQELLAPQSEHAEIPSESQAVYQDMPSEEYRMVDPLITTDEEEEEPSFSTPPRPDSSSRFDLHGKLRSLMSKKYRERKAIERAFSGSAPQELPVSRTHKRPASPELSGRQVPSKPHALDKIFTQPKPQADGTGAQFRSQRVDSDLLNAVKKLKPRQKSELSKRGVVRVIYHATIDKDICPLCEYLDGMVMDPDDPATDIFSPPLFSGCTCSREYVLKTEKPSNWPKVTFHFPPKELLGYLQKE